MKHIFRKSTCTADKEDCDIHDIRTAFSRMPLHTRNTHVPDAKHLCIHCDKCFKTRQSLSNHRQRCAPLDTTKGMDTLIREIIKTEIMNALSQSNPVINQNVDSISNCTINQYNVMINVQPREFDDISALDTHLSDEFKTQCIFEQDLPKLIKAIYCNPDTPHNHCIRLRNRKQKIFEVIEEGKWVKKDGEDVLQDLQDNGYRILSTHYRENRCELDRSMTEEGIYRQVKNWMDAVNDDKKDVCDYVKKKFVLLFDNHKMMLLGK